MDALLGALDALTLLPLLASGERRAVGWSTVGAFFVILGVAGAAPEWAALAHAPESFVAVSAGFVWLGFGCLGAAGWYAARGLPALSLHRLGPVGVNLAITVAAVVVAYLFYEVWHLLLAASWRGAVAGAGLAGTGAALFTLLEMTRAARPFTWLDERWLAPRWRAGPSLPPRTRQVLGAVTGAAVLTVALSGNLLAAVAAALIATVAAHRLARAAGRAAPLPVQPAVAVVGLLGFSWLAATIAGSDVPLSLPGILDSPFSETAEALLALFLGLGAWALLGLWPFHGAGPGSALAFVGGALLLQWGVGLVPSGMEHAAPLFGIVAGVAVLHAAATGRAGEYASALGILALGAGAGTWGLFALASILATMRLLDYRPPVPGLDRRQLGGIAMIPALASVLPSALRGETFVTTLAVLAGVALFRPRSD